ncbi:hypothetical protein GCK32_022035, partial [Trichostrongylus colubriformis]
MFPYFSGVLLFNGTMLPMRYCEWCCQHQLPSD